MSSVGSEWAARPYAVPAEELRGGHRVYRVKTVADLAKIPTGRIDAFLADLGAWMTQRGEHSSLEACCFAWIDDGVVGLRGVNLHFPDGTAEYLENPAFGGGDAAER